MDWKPYLSTQEVVFYNWLVSVMGRGAADYYKGAADPDYRHRHDPDYYPQYMTKNDMQDDPKGR